MLTTESLVNEKINRKRHGPWRQLRVFTIPLCITDNEFSLGKHWDKVRKRVWQRIVIVIIINFIVEDCMGY